MTPKFFTGIKVTRNHSKVVSSTATSLHREETKF